MSISNIVKNILLQHLSLDELYVNTNQKNCYIIAVSRIFYGITELERHKIIYAPLMTEIINKNIHAVTIKTFDPEEWIVKRKFYIA
ncbi:BolA/IbaG family iron-sulfur metabolism protein [Candidatus Blochmannia ocreatus (nom. nud.)]|uniref:BolA/IbaG family iron-sulfur metabolism protein n=1 Tax=Candidatus Blochmannia ocreatus (nom. nud.) TaxID=251538 RepID=A0ABY4STC9_9ENTR|nr:BolA/IbaG family iron-sulfur metabolism protein [Candidatus Blochmannia ocreatus]URJ25136.1 BolA/IbaG family iron-sulfur metabolism protein [Candidatus Blochmannia ocreatus]